MSFNGRSLMMGALVIIAFGIACAGRAVAAPTETGATATTPKAAAAEGAKVIQDKDIYWGPKTYDLEFFLPGEYTQVPAEDAAKHGDAFEAFGPATGTEFRPHIEMIVFQNLPANAEINKDILEQIGKGMSAKVNDYKMVDQGKATVAGKETPSASATFHFKPSKNDKAVDATAPMRNKTVLFVHKANGKDIGFMLVFTTAAAKYDAQVEAFDHLIGSIAYPSVADAAKTK